MAIYTLSGSVSAPASAGTSQPGLSPYAAQFCMFQETGGTMHFLAPFWGPTGTAWYLPHVNLTTGATRMVTGNGQGTARYVYDPVHNKIHTAAQYCQGYWNIYDVATGTVSF